VDIAGCNRRPAESVAWLMVYSLTIHAEIRKRERGISDDDIAAALSGRVVQDGDRFFHYDRATRTLLVVEQDIVITMFRIRGKTIKRLVSK
jgi:hypothetical protein